MLWINGMNGLGDNIYQRPFIRAAAQREPVWLSTSWPELYADIDRVRFAPTQTALRTQARHLARQPAARWSAVPAGARRVDVRYGARDLMTGSILAAMEKQLPLGDTPFSFDLPAGGDTARLRSIPRPYAVVRPATLRREWLTPSRNPRPEYLTAAAKQLRARGFTVVSVADIDGAAEWWDGPPPVEHDIAWHAGELDVTELAALVRGAAAVVGGVGWIVPMAMAAGVPLFIVFGGRGGHNAFDKIGDARIDTRRIGMAVPANFCMCIEAAHACDKTIPGFDATLASWLDGLPAC